MKREEVVHVRRAQHWTFCNRKARDTARVMGRGPLPGLVREHQGRPPGVCRACYRAWREDGQRRR